MRRVLIVAAALAVLLGASLLFGAGKFLLGVYLQLSSPLEAATPAPLPATSPFVVAFDAAASSPEFFDPQGARDVVGLSPELADGVWQRNDRHELAIRLGPEAEDPRFRITSFGTRLWHKQKRITTMYFYPFEGLLDYPQALAQSQQLFRSLGLADPVAWSEYERRLSDRPIDEFIPVLEFSAAKLFLKLSCLGWNPELPAKSQLARVTCKPVIGIDANRAGG